MNFNEHLNLENSHAILSPSKYYWLRYETKEQFEKLVTSMMAADKGTKDHEFACLCIKRNQKLPKSKSTLNQYVNDAIGFHMTPEQPLVYTENCFGTADAISYNDKKKFLRIHDLKTGTIPGKFEQLLCYAGYFCLEYNIDPRSINYSLRIYQSNEISEINPEPEEVSDVIDQIILANKWVNEIREKVGC